MTRCVALLRGINVGDATRIAMADLRNLLEGLGFSEVRAVLNNGDAVFRTAGSRAAKVTPAFEAAIRSRFGLSVPVLVVFPTAEATLTRAEALQAEALEPEALPWAARPRTWGVPAGSSSPGRCRRSPGLAEAPWLPGLSTVSSSELA